MFQKHTKERSAYVQVQGGSQISNGCPNAEQLKFLRFIGPTPLKTPSLALSAFLAVKLVDKSKHNSFHHVSRRQLHLQAPIRD